MSKIEGAAAFFEVEIARTNKPRIVHRLDIAVLFGLLQNIDWPSIDVEDEGVRPRLIIEVTSL